ncbi:MAG: hypothetical protein AB2L24_21735 [Mangrovibacterium sp.]
MDSIFIHITHNARILCHTYEAGLMLTVDFNDATGMNPDQLCPDCHRRHLQICQMIGAVPTQSKEIRIGPADKRLILQKMKNKPISQFPLSGHLL